MNTLKTIDSFTNSYFFLSNFYPCKILYDQIEFPSVEHAYQAMKCLDPASRKEFLTCTPGQAKRLGKKVLLRLDWSSIKQDIMY
ncbi:MAG: NADAR family protein, partial [Bacteroidetes bacterium]|nr:NADAR family protein [Bacteroidota bacterium]